MLSSFLEYYRTQSKYTDFGEFSPLLKKLPDDVSEVCKIARNVIEHFHGINKQKIKPSRLLEIDIRYNKEIMARIKKSGHRSILEDIPFLNKVIGTCRTQAVFTCGLLRMKGIPARVRYKYCTYFVEEFNHEQVVVDYWCFVKKRWLIADPAMNHEVLAEKGITIDFDLYDVPEDKSMSVARAWQLCRQNLADPDMFGAFSKNSKYTGMAHIRRKLYQDLACLNKIEVVEWDRWGTFLDNDLISSEEISFCDYLSELMTMPTLNDEALYENLENMHEKIVPAIGISVSPVNGDYEITY